ncbi:hypothetical protein Tco_0462841 [Tanacetum coccineum]
MIVGIKERRHGPSDAIHNPSQPFECVDIKYVAVSSSLRLLKPKCTNRNIRVILFSIHSDDGNPSSVNIKQHCGSNYDNHELPHHQRSLKLNQGSSSGEIVSLDEEEEVESFQDKYEHVGQEHKLIMKVKSR